MKGKSLMTPSAEAKNRFTEYMHAHWSDPKKAIAALYGQLCNPALSIRDMYLLCAEGRDISPVNASAELWEEVTVLYIAMHEEENTQVLSSFEEIIKNYTQNPDSFPAEAETLLELPGEFQLAFFAVLIKARLDSGFELLEEIAAACPGIPEICYHTYITLDDSGKRKRASVYLKKLEDKYRMDLIQCRIGTYNAIKDTNGLMDVADDAYMQYHRWGSKILWQTLFCAANSLFECGQYIPARDYLFELIRNPGQMNIAKVETFTMMETAYSLLLELPNAQLKPCFDTVIDLFADHLKLLDRSGNALNDSDVVQAVNRFVRYGSRRLEEPSYRKSFTNFLKTIENLKGIRNNPDYAPILQSAKLSLESYIFYEDSSIPQLSRSALCILYQQKPDALNSMDFLSIASAFNFNKNLEDYIRMNYPLLYPNVKQFIRLQKMRAAQASARKPIVKGAARIGRNDPCPCGSGKKYKKCCGRDL